MLRIRDICLNPLNRVIRILIGTGTGTGTQEKFSLNPLNRVIRILMGYGHIKEEISDEWSQSPKSGHSDSYSTLFKVVIETVKINAF